MESKQLTAIQILEKLGAEASLDPSQISPNDKEQINKLVNSSAFFNAALVHSPAEDDEPEEETEEEAPEDKSAS
jgi:hypothetical protein